MSAKIVTTVQCDDVVVVLNRDNESWWDFPWSGSVPGTGVRANTCATRWGALWVLKRRYKAYKRNLRKEVTLCKKW